MSRTNLDFLIQVTGPVGDRASCAMPRADEVLPPFGDHLSKAASSVQDGVSRAVRSKDRSVSSGSSSNDSGSPQQSSRTDAAPAANATVDDRDDTESDESCGPNQVCGMETSNVPDESANVSTEANNDGESDEEKSADLALTATGAVEANVGTNALPVTTNEALSEPALAVESVTQSESTADATKIQPSVESADTKRSAAKLEPPDMRVDESQEGSAETSKRVQGSELLDQSAVAKTTKQSPSEKSTAGAEDETLANRNELPGNGDAVNETNGDTISKIQVAKPSDESPKADQHLNEPALPGESNSGTDEPSQEKNARSAIRQRGDADAIANKVATMVVANGVVTQPRDGDAVTESMDGTTPTAKAEGAKTDGVVDAANRLLPNAGAAKGVGRANGLEELPRVDPARFVARVAKAFHTAQERGGTLQLRLSPPELGAMRLELMVKDGVMTASLETETAAARRVLLEHLPALRDRLSEQNIRIERFDVDVRRENTGGHADPRASHDQQPPQHGRPERRQPTMPQRESTTPRPSAPVLQPLTDTPGINLVA